MKHLAATFSEASQSKNDGSFVFLNNLKISNVVNIAVLRWIIADHEYDNSRDDGEEEDVNEEEDGEEDVEEEDEEDDHLEAEDKTEGEGDADEEERGKSEDESAQSRAVR